MPWLVFYKALKFCSDKYRLLQLLRAWLLRFLTCNNLFITYYTINKRIKPPSWSTRRHSQNCKAILPAKFDARRQPKSKIKRATQLVQLNDYNLFDWTIQTREVIWYHFTSLKWYHITLRVSFLVTGLSHWYPHVICNKKSLVHGKENGVI